MADNTKISELDQIQSLSNNDEFMVVDKSVTSGKDASSSGKTTRVTLNQLKEAVSASGAKGDKGDQGPQGVQGAQGARGPAGADGARGPAGATGQKGATGATGARGATGATGGQGPKGDRGATGPAGPRGATGATGTRGANGPAGPKGSTGSTGAPGNSNFHLLFGHTNGTVDPTGQKIRKTSGGGNNWNTQVISNVSYANGCYVSFRPSGYPTMMMGLNSKSDLGSVSYQSLDFCFYLHENKVLAVYESGKGYTIGSYSPSDVLTITYDNYTIRYLQNGQIKRSVTVGAGKTYHLDSSLHMHGKTDWATSMIAFGPMGAVGTRGATGSTGARGATGPAGPRGATGPTGPRGPQGPTGQKGASGVTSDSNFVRKSGLGQSSYYSLDNWLEFYSSSNPGVYWSTGTGKGWHIYPQATANMYIRSGNASTGSFKFTCNSSTVQAHLYWNSAQELGFLSNSGNWRIRSRLNNSYGPNLWFHNQSGWSGNAGDNLGKIEYHSNAFYINAGSNASNVTIFRRGGSNVSQILSDGTYQGPGLNVSGANIRGNGSWGIRVNGKSGHVDIGSANVTYAHIQTDRPNFYFNKTVYVDGDLISYRDNAKILTAKKAHSYNNITVGPSSTHLQTTHIGKGGHVTIGSSAGSVNEGGQLNLRYPEKSPLPNQFWALDSFYDNGPHIKNYHDGTKAYHMRMFHHTADGKGHTVFSAGSDHQVHIHGHLNLYDGNDACVIHCGNPGGSRAHPYLSFRASSTWKSWYNFMRIDRRNGNCSTIGSYYSRQNLSDIRKKKDIERLDSTDSLNTLMQLKPVKFNWKDESKNKESGNKTLGLIAQEIEEVLPGLVVNIDDIDNEKAGNIDGSPMKSSTSQESVKTKVVEYTELVPLLISAVQRLTQEVQTLKQRK